MEVMIYRMRRSFGLATKHSRVRFKRLNPLGKFFSLIISPSWAAANIARLNLKRKTANVRWITSGTKDFVKLFPPFWLLHVCFRDCYPSADRAALPLRPFMSEKHWKTFVKSRFPWEQEALDFIHAGFPAQDTYTAWANFEFVAEDGSINEVDLLVACPQGVFLIEIKGRPGTVSGDPQNWL